jgi:para-aminobenzoate synthetase component 1
MEKIQALQAHILRGNCYEINFCQEFFAEDVLLDPFAVFQRLMQVSPNPFSAFYRLHDKFLLCASPERFLAKKGAKVISQPIKGTIQRDLADRIRDEQLKESLRLSPKEQAENVMVVDLVRNDLTQICKPATGAPKLSVMKLIDEHEPSARGIFSGSVGYKAPNGDFDFNVVIRSIMYNQTSQYLSYQVGSGITFYSHAEKEWEECMLKAEAIRKVLSL